MMIPTATHKTFVIGEIPFTGNGEQQLRPLRDGFAGELLRQREQLASHRPQVHEVFTAEIGHQCPFRLRIANTAEGLRIAGMGIADEELPKQQDRTVLLVS